MERLGPALDTRLRALGSSLGSPAFIRVFKESRVLELWVGASDRFVLFERYPICSFSGGLGPKTREGDKQAPEGLYRVGEDQLNPYSRYHLALNLGYPNAYESARAWTGDSLMVHGDCVSIGCYAMGDHAIAEIYTVVHQALEQGQEAVWVHAFPFALTEENLKRHAAAPFRPYWQSLVPAYEAFERNHMPPNVVVSTEGYTVGSLH
jgi:murein L,D-transpeptidase YafK